MSALPAPDQFIRPAPPSLCSAYSVLPGVCCEPGCGQVATEEHHAVPKSRSRAWKERDWAILYGQLVRIKFPVCASSHLKLTDNEARLWCDEVEGQLEWRWQLNIGDKNYEDVSSILEPADQPLEDLGCSEVQALPALSDSEAPVFRAPSTAQSGEAAGEGNEPEPRASEQVESLSEGGSFPAQVGRETVSRGAADSPPSESDHDCSATCACGKTLTRKRRPKGEKGPRRNWSVWVPSDAENGAAILDELLEAARDQLKGVLAVDEDTPTYYVLVPVLTAFIQEAKAA